MTNSFKALQQTLHFLFIILISIYSISPIYSDDECECFKYTESRYRDNSLVQELKNNFDTTHRIIMPARAHYLNRVGRTHCEPEYIYLYNNYRKEHKKLQDRYSPISEQDKNAYYPSRLEQMFEYGESDCILRGKWEKKERSFYNKHGILILDWYIYPASFHKHMTEIDESVQNGLNIIARRRKKSWDICYAILEECLRTHSSLRSRYELGFLHFNQGNYSDAVESMQILIEESKRQSNDKYLSSDTYYQLGIVCNLSHDYANAIEALTKAIEKDPTNKQFYLERAISYFELGNFDLAIKDYLEFRPEHTSPSTDPDYFEFSQGFLNGAPEGLYVGAIEFPSSLLYSVHGIGQLLWAGINDPIQVSNNFIDSANRFIDEVNQKESPFELIEICAPDTYKLIKNWNSYDQRTRGEKLGFILGKYGVDFLTAFGVTKCTQAYLNFRQANAICNLESLSISKEKALAVLHAAEKASEQRRMYCATQKVDMGSQGKHIIGHNSYETLSDSRKATQSIWTHPHPEELIKKKIGEGKPTQHNLDIELGNPGYKERVDFGEIIGEFVDRDTKKRYPTTNAVIHHSKTGVHAVPCRPHNYDILRNE